MFHVGNHPFACQYPPGGRVRAPNGFDPLTGGVLNEIPGGAYTGVGSEPQTVRVPYAREAYLLITYGLDSLISPAPYALTFATIDAAGDAFDQADVSGMAFRGSVDRFAFSTGDGPITPIPSSPPTRCRQRLLAGADGQWHASDVVLVCSATDSQSGLANPADASVSLSTMLPQARKPGTHRPTAGRCATTRGIAPPRVPFPATRLTRRGHPS